MVLVCQRAGGVIGRSILLVREMPKHLLEQYKIIPIIDDFVDRYSRSTGDLKRRMDYYEAQGIPQGSGKHIFERSLQWLC